MVKTTYETLQPACPSHTLVKKAIKKLGLIPPKIELRLLNRTTGTSVSLLCTKTCRLHRILKTYCQHTGTQRHCTHLYTYNKRISDKATAYSLGLTECSTIEVEVADAE